MAKSVKCLKMKKYLTSEEVQRLYKACDLVCKHGTRNKLIIKMMYVFGLRVSELCSMTWDQIDLKESAVYVQRLKNGKSMRQPIYTKDLHRDLTVHKNRMLKAGKNSAYVFISQQNTAINRKTIDTFLKNVGLAAGFEYPIHAHMLRHGCGYDLANRGVSTTIIQAVLGHRDSRNTAIYTEVAAKTLEMLRR